MAPGIAGKIRFRRWSSLVWLMVGAACLGLALHAVDLQGMQAALVQAVRIPSRRAWLAAALLVAGGNNFIKVWRWQALMGGRAGGWVKVGRALFMAQLLNAALPLRVGDVTRVAQVGAAAGAPFGGEKSTAATRYAPAAGSVVIEKLLDMVAYLGLTLFAMAWLSAEAWLKPVAGGLALLLGVSLAGVVGLLSGRDAINRLLQRMVERLPDRWAKALHPWLAALEPGLAAVINRRAWLGGLLWTAGVWATAVLTNLCVAQAAAMPLSVGQAVLLLIALQAGMLVVQSPGRLGVFEAVGVWLLTGFGVPSGLALGYTLLLHGVVFAPILVLGGWAAVFNLDGTER